MNTNDNSSLQKSWLEKLSDAFLREPQTLSQLITLLRDAEQRNLFDGDTLSLLESVLNFSQLTAREVMIPRHQMVVAQHDDTLETLYERIHNAPHSRFPVISENPDEIIGILHSRDLLQYQLDSDKKFDMDDVLRPALVIPESKKLSLLLTDFRRSRNHMSIVVDEYGRISGFITIEDVIEQIVGDIEDEFDVDEEAYIKQHEDGQYIVKAHMPVEEFNEAFSLSLEAGEFDSLGGLLLKTHGQLPKPGDIVTLNDLQFSILSADNRRIKLVEFSKRGIEHE